MGGLAACGALGMQARAAKVRVVYLSRMARLYSMRMGTSAEKIALQNRYHALKFEMNARRSWVNQVMVWLHEPCRGGVGGWALQEVDFKHGIDPILRSHVHAPGKVPQTVVLDPGHGGKDPGAVGTLKVLEKQVVLDISMRVKRWLEQRNFHVRLTRVGDVYLSLVERVEYARRVGADLLVSIHADGAVNARATGVETFITTAAGYDSSNHYGKSGDTAMVANNRHDGANAILGFALQRNLLKASGQVDRGLRRARFTVIRNAPCPAALVECGFLTNSSEERLLRSESYREQVAKGIANGVLAYRTLVQRAKPPGHNPSR